MTKASEGLYHCNRYWPWMDLTIRLFPTTNRWHWICPDCNEVIREDPYFPPSDAPDDLVTQASPTTSG